MKTYLVDFENVKSKGLTGIENLNETDTVIIFYSENSDTISFEMHQKVLCSKAEVEYFKVNVGGKNALDFQLSTLLGYLVGRDVYSHIFVISNDKGFDFLHDFWQGKYISAPNCVVYRTRTIAAAINYAQGERRKAALSADEEITVEDIEMIGENITGEETTEIVSAEADTTESAQDTVVEETSEKPDCESVGEAVQSAETDCVPACAEVAPEDEVISQTAAEETVAAVKTDTDEKKSKAAKKRKSAAVSYSDTLNEILSAAECSAEDIGTISSLLLSSSTKEEFHNLLAKTFKQQATDLYKLLRPKYLKLKALYAEEDTAEKKSDESEKLCEQASDSANEVQEETVYSDTVSTRLAELLAGLCTAEELATIKELFDNAATKQQLYIRMVKAFKKDKGCQFYNAIRSEYTSLHK